GGQPERQESLYPWPWSRFARDSAAVHPNRFRLVDGSQIHDRFTLAATNGAKPAPTRPDETAKVPRRPSSPARVTATARESSWRRIQFKSKQRSASAAP